MSDNINTIDELDGSVPSYVNDPTQVGNKIWRIVADDGIKVNKTTSSSVDTYTFNADISNEAGNSIKVYEDGLYSPEVNSKSEELKADLEELKKKVEQLKNVELRPTRSVIMRTEGSIEKGNKVIYSDIVISTDSGNNLQLKNDGLYSKASDYGPGSIPDIERRLRALEDELLIISQQIDNLKTTAFIDNDGVITPPIVIPINP